MTSGSPVKGFCPNDIANCFTVYHFSLGSIACLQVLNSPSPFGEALNEKPRHEFRPSYLRLGRDTVASPAPGIPPPFWGQRWTDSTLALKFPVELFSFPCYNSAHPHVYSNTCVYPRQVSEKNRRECSAPDISPCFTGAYGYDWYAAPSLVYRRAPFCFTPHPFVFVFQPYPAIAEGCPSLALAPIGVRYR